MIGSIYLWYCFSLFHLILISLSFALIPSMPILFSLTCECLWISYSYILDLSPPAFHTVIRIHLISLSCLFFSFLPYHCIYMEQMLMLLSTSTFVRMIINMTNNYSNAIQIGLITQLNVVLCPHWHAIRREAILFCFCSIIFMFHPNICKATGDRFTERSCMPCV